MLPPIPCGGLSPASISEHGYCRTKNRERSFYLEARQSPFPSDRGQRNPRSVFSRPRISGSLALISSNMSFSSHICIGSSTSISILSNALLRVFPWASFFSDFVPPPPRDWWSKKFSAFRFGSSKRSTWPKQIPSKCFLTRSAVTYFSIIS